MAVSAPQGRRVLACDDEPQILRALKVILSEEGYVVLTAGTMDEALDVAAVSAVDAAIVDGAASLLTFAYGLMRAGLWTDERGENAL